MDNKKISYLPFNAINEFMRPDFRHDVILSTLQALPNLPSNHQATLNKLIKKVVQVPGFRNSTLAPAPIKANAAINAFEKSSVFTAAIISAWAESKAELRSQIYDLLDSRGWKVLPAEADRTQLPGFMTRWPKGEDFETINKAFREAKPEAEPNADDVSLMTVWIANRLPFEQEPEAEEGTPTED